MEDIILIGIGGHAHSVVDSIESGGHYHIAGFLDTAARQAETYKDYSVIGTDDRLLEFYERGIRNAFITIGYMGKGNVRTALWKTLKRIGYSVPSIIDPSAVIAEDAWIGEGTFVGKRAVVNANAKVGSMCIINTAAVVEHDCCIGDFSHIAVNTVLCGNVKIGNESFIGANATIIQGLSIGENTVIGAGTTVTHNISNNIIMYKDIEKNRWDE